jgi:hypothetical protein
MSDSLDARKSQSESARMTIAFLDRIKGDLEDDNGSTSMRFPCRATAKLKNFSVNSSISTSVKPE